MSDCIIMISRNHVKDGMLEEFVRHYQKGIPAVEADKPGTLLQAATINEEGTQAVILRVFRDEKAMDDHLEGADQRSTVAYQYIEPTGVEIYGSASEKSLAIIKAVVGHGVPIAEYRQAIGGLLRLGPS